MGKGSIITRGIPPQNGNWKWIQHTLLTSDLQLKQRQDRERQRWREEGEGEGKKNEERGRRREKIIKKKKNAKTTLIGPRSSSHVMLFENTVYQSYPIYCKLLHSAGTVGSHTHTHTHTHCSVTSLWKRLCSLRPCLAPLLPDSSTSIFSGFSSSKASNFSITPERLQIQQTHTHRHTDLSIQITIQSVFLEHYSSTFCPQHWKGIKVYGTWCEIEHFSVLFNSIVPGLKWELYYFLFVLPPHLKNRDD